jgi:2-polyprenyl-6-methoxyphenol hydroxylase-like FAD-dependent oxidoreductase
MRPACAGVPLSDSSTRGSLASPMTHLHSAPAGVRLSDGSVLSADLVVDCSGRGSSLPSWLAAAGCQRPRTTRATVDGGYAAWWVYCAARPCLSLEVHKHGNNLYSHHWLLVS